jgi:hypothetical protein
MIEQPVVVVDWFILGLLLVMSSKVRLSIVVAGILIVLLVLFLSFGHLKHERESDLARNPGNDELSQTIRTEADEYRITNRNQQIGILTAGIAIGFVVIVWRVGQRKRERE